jgi:hypothetical protein
MKENRLLSLQFCKYFMLSFFIYQLFQMCLLSQTSTGNNTIYGKISDKETGKPVPFIIVFLKNTTNEYYKTRN